MTKEKYLQLLNQENYSFLMYLYFIEKSQIVMTTQDFSKLFSDYLSKIAIKYLIDSNNLLDYYIETTIEYFNYKFNVTLILRDNKVIRIF